jgi:hypothetical protein
MGIVGAVLRGIPLPSPGLLRFVSLSQSSRPPLERCPKVIGQPLTVGMVVRVSKDQGIS